MRPIEVHDGAEQVELQVKVADARHDWAVIHCPILQETNVCILPTNQSAFWL